MDIGGRKVTIFVGAALVVIGLGLSGCASKKEPEEPGIYHGESFSIKFPNEWKINERSGGMWVTGLVPQKTGDNQFQVYVTVNVVEIDTSRGLSLEQFHQGNLDNLSKKLLEFQLHEEGQGRIKDLDTKWFIISYKVGRLEVKTLQYMVLKGSRGYVISCGAGVDEFLQYKSTFEDVAQSLSLDIENLKK
jgi:hypothetical protein